MSDDTTDILNTDLGGVDISQQVLPKDEYLLDIKSVEQVTNEDKGTKNIKIVLSTAEQTRDIRGEIIPPGFLVYDNISLTPTEKYSKNQIQKRLKTFRLAATGDEAGAFLPLEQYKGKRVKAVLKVQEASEDYAARNNVSRYVTD